MVVTMNELLRQRIITRRASFNVRSISSLIGLDLVALQHTNINILSGLVESNPVKLWTIRTVILL